MIPFPCVLPSSQRRRIYTEAKAKVVASVWGKEFVQFLAALAILPQTIWETRILVNRIQ